MRTLEGTRLRAFLLAQAAFELSNGFVFVLFHPGDEVALDDAHLAHFVADALLGPGGVQVAVAEKVSLVIDDRVPHSVLLQILRMKASA